MSKKKYFCDGPQGNFVTTDLDLANSLVSAVDKDNDWTITEIGTTAPECWGVFAWMNSRWVLQFPVFGNKKDADEDVKHYCGGTRLEVRPLYQEIIS